VSPDRTPDDAGREPHLSRRTTLGLDVLIGALLLASSAAGLGMAVVYMAGGQVQVEGVLLAVALGALALAIGLWAKHFMPQGPVSEDRPVLESSDEVRAAVATELDQSERPVLRRRVLATLLFGAVGSLGLAAVVPFK